MKSTHSTNKPPPKTQIVYYYRTKGMVPRCGHLGMVPRCGHLGMVPRCGHLGMMPRCGHHKNQKKKENTINLKDAKANANSNPLALPGDLNYADQMTEDAGIITIEATNGSEAPARVIQAKTAGTIEFHPISCNDENGNEIYRTEEFEAKEVFSCIIDKIKVAGTSVPLADIKVLI